MQPDSHVHDLTPPPPPTSTGKISVPLAWFIWPLLQSIKRLVKPATTRTARALQTVKAKIPRQVMEAMLENVPDDGAAGFKRSSAGRIEPTRRTKNNLVWEYNFAKASTVAKILRLELSDVSKGPHGKLPKGLAKRGFGASRLNLSRASEHRKQKATTISMVAGTLSFTYVEPKHQADMGTLVLSFMVLTMDKSGHISWPSNFSDRSRAILRKAVRADLNSMMEDRLYPTHRDMANAITAMGDSIQIFPAATPATTSSSSMA